MRGERENGGNGSRREEEEEEQGEQGRGVRISKKCLSLPCEGEREMEREMERERQREKEREKVIHFANQRLLLFSFLSQFLDYSNPLFQQFIRQLYFGA